MRPNPMRPALIIALALVITCPIPGYGDAPPPFPDFTFKMSKPPKAGTTRRINVQIEPQPATVAAKPEAAKATPAPPSGATYAWYWTHVPPEIAVNAAERTGKALLGLQKGTVPGPRLQDLQGIAQAQGATILRETIGTQISPALVLAVIAVESSGRKDAVSKAGAQGLMQLMPATAERFGVKDAFDPAQNVRGGVAFLDFLMETFDGDPVLVLAGYNAGENSIPRHGGVPPFAETRDYVPKVLAAFQTASGLCLTPPELVSDGCVFRVSSATN